MVCLDDAGHIICTEDRTTGWTVGRAAEPGGRLCFGLASREPLRGVIGGGGCGTIRHEPRMLFKDIEHHVRSER